MFTTAEVAETPAAVATAVSAYEFAVKLPVVILNGALVTDPKKVALPKNDTLVTVPLLTVALAPRWILAGAENTALLAGFVMLTEGGGAASGAVERV